MKSRVYIIIYRVTSFYFVEKTKINDDEKQKQTETESAAVTR